MRHIVVEGVDGSGKTTLIEHMSKTYGLPVHPRASTSVGGPVPNLDAWVEAEFTRERKPGIYDRHPVISEPIYGPIIRQGLPGAFSSPGWLYTQVRRLAAETVVVWCSPPWATVYLNIRGSANNQMPGVMDNAYRLYQTYVSRRKAWLGPSVDYDYTRTPALREFMIKLAYQKAQDTP